MSTTDRITMSGTLTIPTPSVGAFLVAEHNARYLGVSIATMPEHVLMLPETDDPRIALMGLLCGDIDPDAYTAGLTPGQAPADSDYPLTVPVTMPYALPTSPPPIPSDDDNGYAEGYDNAIDLIAGYVTGTISHHDSVGLEVQRDVLTPGGHYRFTDPSTLFLGVCSDVVDLFGALIIHYGADKVQAMLQQALAAAATPAPANTTA